MKAMILAAGLGKRMHPLTLTTPKPLLKVADKPLIVWHIEALQRAGVVDVVINAAWLKEQLLEYLGDGSQWGVKIHWSLEDEGLETAGGIIHALPKLGEQPFLVVNADVWTNYDFSTLIGRSLGPDLAHLVLVHNPPQHPLGDFTLSDGRVYSFEQAQTGEALTLAGISLVSPQLFAGLSSGKRALAPILRQAMLSAQISGEKMQSDWVDVGTPERLKQLDSKLAAQLL